MIEWEDLVYVTAERFGGQLPQPTTSAAIAAVYTKAPHAVTRAIDRVAEEFEAGGIRSPWGILKSRVERITPERNATHKANDTDKAIQRAEQWIRNAGIHYDRETEIIDELYGDRGQLRHHPETQTRILELWQELRPLGELIEHEHETFMARHAEQRRKIDKQPEPTQPGNLTTEALT